MALFNLSIINTFIDAYIKIRRHKNKGQATDDEIDRKCVEIKQRFADAGDNVTEWVALFSYLGGIADGSQNNKYINQLPSMVRSVASLLPATQYTETQSDLSQAIWALIHYLHRIIFETPFKDGSAEQTQQTGLRKAIDTRTQQLRMQRDTAFDTWNNTFLEEKASDDDTRTKQVGYFQLQQELLYLGDRSQLCLVIPHCYQTYEKPKQRRLGTNSTDPMQENHRLAAVIHKDYDRHYTMKIMLEEDRNLLESYEEAWKTQLNTASSKKVEEKPPVLPPVPASPPAAVNTTNNIRTSPMQLSVVTRDPELDPRDLSPESSSEPSSAISPANSSPTSSPKSPSSTEAVRQLLGIANNNNDQKTPEAPKPAKLPTVKELQVQFGMSKHAAQLRLAELRKQNETQQTTGNVPAVFHY